MKTLRIAAALVLTTAGFPALSPAHAGDQANLTVVCTSSEPVLGNADIQACMPAASFTVNSEGGGARYVLHLTAPATHCSEVNYYVLKQGGTFGQYTGWLNRGERATLDLGRDLARGPHLYDIVGVGRRGGCNSTGAVNSWGVSAASEVLPG